MLFSIHCNNIFLSQYLNSGAGGIAGMFLHDRYAHNPPAHLCGWWSNKQETRFKMAEKVDLAIGADSFRLSNPAPWLACLNMAGLEVLKYRVREQIIFRFHDLYFQGLL